MPSRRPYVEPFKGCRSARLREDPFDNRTPTRRSASLWARRCEPAQAGRNGRSACGWPISLPSSSPARALPTGPSGSAGLVIWRAGARLLHDPAGGLPVSGILAVGCALSRAWRPARGEAAWVGRRHDGQRDTGDAGRWLNGKAGRTAAARSAATNRTGHAAVDREQSPRRDGWHSGLGAGQVRDDHPGHRRSPSPGRSGDRPGLRREAGTVTSPSAGQAGRQYSRRHQSPPGRPRRRSDAVRPVPCGERQLSGTASSSSM